MINPNDFSFKIVKDQDLGEYIQFYNLGKDESADIWEELGEFLDNNLIGLYSLEESSYEYEEGLNPDGIVDGLIKLGFREI